MKRSSPLRAGATSRFTRAAVIVAGFAIPSLALPVAAVAQAAPASASAAPKDLSEHVEAHIKALHNQLEITPAEEPQWTTFAQVMRNNASQMEQAFAARGASMSTMNAVQDLQSYSQISQIQSDNMQKLAASFQTLYASFPAAQQKVADDVFRAKMASHTKPNLKSATP